jgi:hypothetical protein
MCRCGLGAGLLFLTLCASPTAAQSIEGTALQRGTHQPISGVFVQLMSEADSAVGSATTDDAGRFVLRAKAGPYHLHAERIGFQPVDSRTFQLEPGDQPLEVELRMGVKAVPLQPLVIRSERPDRHLTVYYQRKKEYGIDGLGYGTFIDGAKLRDELRHAQRATDILQDVPGVLVRGVGGVRRQLFMRGPYSITEPRRCIPEVFIDGIPTGVGTDIDQLVSLAEISAVEVYPGINKPGELQRGHLCGAVVIWTGPQPEPQENVASGGKHRFNFKTVALVLGGFALMGAVIKLAGF